MPPCDRLKPPGEMKKKRKKRKNSLQIQRRDFSESPHVSLQVGMRSKKERGKNEKKNGRNEKMQSKRKRRKIKAGKRMKKKRKS